MTREREWEIIRSVLNGDTDAFEELVLENQKKVYNLALKMTGGTEDAFDISQEAFVKAYTSLKNFRGECSFSAWLYRLTSNMCIDFLRKHKKERIMSLTSYEEEDSEKELDIPDVRYLPETEYERRELREAIDQGLRTLSAEHRQIVIMRDINGLTYTEIADCLKVEEGTVKSRLARARGRLAEYIGKNGNFGESYSSKKRKGE